MGLITVDYFNALPLGIKSSSLPTSDTLQTLIDEASIQVERYCDRYFAGGAYSDYIPGHDKMRLVLENYPVTALTSVSYWDELNSTGTIDITGLRLYPSKGIVEWTNYVNGPFMRGRTYQVNYTAGYGSNIPGPVQHATALWVTELLQPNFTGPMRNSAEFVPMSSQQIVELLEPYRRRRLG